MTDQPAHSRYGGSKASIWLNCAGAVALSDTVPPRPSSRYAAEGTAAHTLGEMCLTGGLHDAYEHVGTMIEVEPEVSSIVDGVSVVLREAVSFVVTAEMADAVNVYLTAVYDEMARHKDAELYVEQRFTFALDSAEGGEVFGSNDALVYSPSAGRLVVFDYKHGAGVSVSAEDNAQLKFYAAGAALSHPEWRIAEVELVIVQPRARDAEENNGGVKRWTMDPIELIEFTGEMEVAIGRSKMWSAEKIENGLPHILIPDSSGSAVLSPGSWCRWCPAAAVCPAKEQQALAVVASDFADITHVTTQVLPKPADMDTARIGKVLLAADIIEAWLGQVRDFAFGAMQQGVQIPDPRGGHFKLVEKIGRRKWIADEQQIADTLVVQHGVDPDDIRPRKLVTITEAERLIKAQVTDKDQRKKALDDMSLAFTLKESSGLTMVPASDKREGVNAVAQDFGSVSLLN